MKEKHMKTLKKIPKFKNSVNETDYWEKSDSTEYIDYSQAARLYLRNLKPSTKSISIRLPEALLQRLKIIANKKDIPYQSLIKVYLAEKIRDELSH
jgi:predicted DNA binding CopG/RHH family protein